MKLLFSPLAREDLRSIIRFIASERPITARKVLDRRTATCRLIAKHPKLGQRRFEYSDDYRSFTVERWVILYEVFAETVEIHRVLDAARDIEPFAGQ